MYLVIKKGAIGCAAPVGCVYNQCAALQPAALRPLWGNYRHATDSISGAVQYRDAAEIG